MLLRGIGLIAISAATLAFAAPASASVNVYNDYADGGSLDGCSYSPEQLRNALSNVPPDIQQYDPRYVDSLNTALANSASGSCGGSGSGSGAAGGSAGGDGNGPGGPGDQLAKDGSPSPGGGADSPKLAAAGAPLDLSSEGGFPVGLAVLAAMLGLLMLAVAGFAIARTDAVGSSGILARPARAVGSARRAVSEYASGIRDRFRRR